jgi:hypothetical protein
MAEGGMRRQLEAGNGYDATARLADVSVSALVLHAGHLAVPRAQMVAWRRAH